MFRVRLLEHAVHRIVRLDLPSSLQITVYPHY
jgi:hypothetical protein